MPTEPALRIAFDATILAAPWTGVARSFAVALAEYARTTDATVALLTRSEAWPRTADSADIATLRTLDALPRVSVRAGPIQRRIFWRRVLSRQGVDLLHVPIAAVPLGTSCPVIATVHDLPWCVRPPLAEPSVGWRHRAAVRTAARHAHAIVTPSTHTASDLRSWLPQPARARITVIPHGLEYGPDTEEPARPANGPIVALGDDRPRKNLARLRRAHRRACAIDSEMPPLRILGTAGEGYVEESTKRELLRSATALVLPSLHEGFGIPVLEAFALGTPVLVSRAASLPEVAGAAAVYFDPADEDELTDRLVQLHREAGLRERLRRAGRRRVHGFSAAATAAAWRGLHDTLLD